MVPLKAAMAAAAAARAARAAPPPDGWHRKLKAGDDAEARHEGGWWQVSTVKPCASYETWRVRPAEVARGRCPLTDSLACLLPQVSVKARVPGNARLKELPQVIVEARGYGVTRTVSMADIRPRS